MDWPEVIGTTYRPPKGFRRFMAALERKVSDGLEEAITGAMRERALQRADELEREADRIRRQAGIE